MLDSIRSSRVFARRIAKFVLTTMGCVLLTLMVANAWLVSATRELIFDDLSRIEGRAVGLVLGTSPYTRYGNQNLLFTHRMMAAAELYASGRVRHLLVSGANPDRTYNEPRKMYQALRRLGVPDSAITLDFAGFRTLDSIVRAQQIFGLDRFVVVSQRYHDYRALFIARYHGIDAVAYIRPQEDLRQPLRAETREYLARFRAVLDLFLIDTDPRFLGPRRPIDMSPIAPFEIGERRQLIQQLFLGLPPEERGPASVRPPLAPRDGHIAPTADDDRPARMR